MRDALNNTQVPVLRQDFPKLSGRQCHSRNIGKVSLSALHYLRSINVDRSCSLLDLARLRTLPTVFAFWLTVASTAATWLGLCLLLLPQRGEMGIGILFCYTPIGINGLLIPAALVALLTGLIRGERLSLVAGGFLFLLDSQFLLLNA